MKHFVQKVENPRSIKSRESIQNSCSDCNPADYTGAKLPRTQPGSGERRNEITRVKHCPATTHKRGAWLIRQRQCSQRRHMDYLKLVGLHWTVLKHQSGDPPIRASLLCYSTRVICTCMLLCFHLYLVPTSKAPIPRLAQQPLYRLLWQYHE